MNKANVIMESESGMHKGRNPDDLRVPRILVVEDDLTSQAFWGFVASKANHLAQVTWATSETEAEMTILDSIVQGHEFDLVITDIFLSGSKTGIDLWTHFAKTLHGRMIVTSGIDHDKFMKFFDKEPLRPMFLQKPLVAHQCIEAVYAALRSSFQSKAST